MAAPPPSPASAWLLSRVDRRCTETAQELLRSMAADLALATFEAVTLRVLSDDGQWLLPVAVHHHDPLLRERMTEVMASTAQTTRSGLWQRVLEDRRPARWHIPAGHVPAEASPEQSEFLRRWPIRAVQGAPLLARDRREPIGGVSLVRYVRDAPFTDDDEALLVEFARRAELALDFHEVVGSLGGRELPERS